VPIDREADKAAEEGLAGSQMEVSVLEATA